MLSGGDKKYQKTKKTKFKEYHDNDDNKDKKQKHHDKTYYRLLKQEKEDYYDV